MSAAVDLGPVLPWWSGLPFAGILLSIALFPLLAPQFWHHNYPKVALVWGLLLTVPFVWIYRSDAVHEILHVLIADYLPFLILLGTFNYLRLSKPECWLSQRFDAAAEGWARFRNPLSSELETSDWVRD